jgi:hypothetical protein
MPPVATMELMPVESSNVPVEMTDVAGMEVSKVPADVADVMEVREAATKVASEVTTTAKMATAATTMVCIGRDGDQ